MQLSDFYLYLPHFICGNYASGWLGGTAFSMGNTNFVNGDLFFIHGKIPNLCGTSCQTYKIGGKSGPLLFCQLPDCSSQNTIAVQLHCPIFVSCVEIHIPLKLPISSIWLCMTRIYPIERDHSGEALQNVNMPATLHIQQDYHHFAPESEIHT